jgi:hydrogenase/urease accessory protein HupE
MKDETAEEYRKRVDRPLRSLIAVVGWFAAVSAGLIMGYAHGRTPEPGSGLAVFLGFCGSTLCLLYLTFLPDTVKQRREHKERRVAALEQQAATARANLERE